MKLKQIWIERKKLILLALLVLLLMILAARQKDLIPPGPVGRVVRTAIQPVVVAVSAIENAASHVWLFFFRARKIDELQTENRHLAAELARIRVEYQLLEDAHAKLQRLSKLTVSQPRIARNVTATIIGISPNFWSRTVTIDRGRRDGVGPDMPVVNQDGLVGIVRDVNDSSALVQLLVDPEFAAGARVWETRHRGFVEGTGELERMRLHLEDPDAPTEPGQRIVTSGMPVGSLFPTGFEIGTITEILRNKFGQPYAVVLPSVRVDRIEEVVVLLELESQNIEPNELPTPPLK